MLKGLSRALPDFYMRYATSSLETHATWHKMGLALSAECPARGAEKADIGHILHLCPHMATRSAPALSAQHAYAGTHPERSARSY